MSSKNFFLTSIFLSLLIFVFGISPAKAFGISPAKMLITADPNTSQTIVLSINNSEKNDLVFKLGVVGVEQDENGMPVFDRGVTDAENWIFPENGTVLIKAGQTKAINFIIKIPDSTQAGSYYTGLFVEPSVEGSSNGQIGSRVISLLTIQVAGVVNEAVLIEKWSTKQSWLNDREWQFDLNLKNTGDVEVLLEGAVSIRNWRGEEIYTKPLGLGNKLLAGSRRALSPAMTVKDNIKLPGLYQAQLKINYGLTSQMTSGIAYVWYFPLWSQVGLVVFGFLILVLVIFVIKRKK